MKLRTRLIIAFVTIILLPILLSGLAYVIFRIAVQQNFRHMYGIDAVSMEFLTNPVEGYGQLTEEEFASVVRMASEHPDELMDMEYLTSTNAILMEKASSLLLVCDGEILYNGGASANVANFLAGHDRLTNTNSPEYYLREHKVVVKGYFFNCQSGEDCVVYIVTRVTNFFSAATYAWVLVVIGVVLLITSAFLIMWIRKGVFHPIAELNVGMQHISDGDFSYVLDVKGTGEIAQMYENYNQMRMRLKESIDEILRQDNQNRELVSNISHDLKTPITSIKGYVEGIMDGVADTPEKMDRYIKTIYNKANDMNRLINELTIYSGIDSNRIPYNFRKLNVTDYFNDCIEEVGLDLESKGIHLDYVNTIPYDTDVIADPEQLKRVVNNIISNSVKYMNKQGARIEIRLLDELDSVRVEIEDNGKGVSAKEIGHIFERFYRTDASRNSAQGGSGIGLSIVKKIIEDHGGYIWATSKEGEGTCMHFVLRKYVKADPVDTI